MSIAEKIKNKVIFISTGSLPFDKLRVGMTFGILVLAEVLSFLVWKFSVVNLICFGAILLITLILSLKKLEYGLYILFAELFIGSHGYLFSLNFGETNISVRMGLFIIIMAVFFMNVILRRRNDDEKSCGKNVGLKFVGIFHSLRSFKMTFIFLGIVILWAFVWGRIRGNNFGDVFLDFNNWLYFLLIFPMLGIVNKKSLENNGISRFARNDIFLKNILSILIAAVVLISVKTIVLFYLFSHNYAEIMGTIYRWVRDTRIGEITLINGNFHRIFIQSQIYALLLFFIILIRSFKNKKFLNPYSLILIPCLITIIISFSRSYWAGLIIGLILYFIVTLHITHYTLPVTFFKSFVKVILVVIISLAIISVIVILPPKVEGQDLLALFKTRATQSEAASSSRLAQLKPLALGISKHPVIGSGFGTTVTYISDDPRILGEFITYAFEWGYLDMILKFGILGMAIYMYLIFIILKRLLISNFQFPISKKNYPLPVTRYTLHFGFALALIALLVVNIFSPYLNHPLGIGFIIITSLLSFRPERSGVEESLNRV